MGSEGWCRVLAGYVIGIAGGHLFAYQFTDDLGRGFVGRILSETEALFLSSVNRLFVMAGFVFVLLSVIISMLLSRTIARPILKAEEAARQIAVLHSPGTNNQQNIRIRLHDQYRTAERCFFFLRSAKKEKFDSAEMEKQIKTLMMDDEVTKKPAYTSICSPKTKNI